MATRIFGFAPGANTGGVIEAVGPTATSAVIALVVDLATNTVGSGSGTRVVSKNEVLLALDAFKDYILADNWPPA